MVVQSARELTDSSVGTDIKFAQRRTRAELQKKCSSVHKVMQEGTDLISSYTRNIEQLKKKECSCRWKKKLDFQVIQ